MPVKGASKVKANVGRWVAEVQGDTEKVLTTIAMTGAGYAKLDTPVDTATLINSQYYYVNGEKAIVGYSSGFSGTTDSKVKQAVNNSPRKVGAVPPIKSGGFNYGLFLHENTKWTPRKKKNARHHFLSNAFESPEYKADYQRIIFNGYKI